MDAYLSQEDGRLVLIIDPANTAERVALRDHAAELGLVELDATNRFASGQFTVAVAAQSTATMPAP